MTIQPYRRTFATTRPIWIGSLMALALCFSFKSGANTITPVRSFPQRMDASPSLDSKRLYALGMIETGNNDRVIGSAGEVSRYQLSPSVWKNYSKSVNYRNPDVALQVARLHWNYLAAYFREKTGRTPDDFDMYVLWNTRFGYYEHKGFSKRAIFPVVQERSQRFVNLVNRSE